MDFKDNITLYDFFQILLNSKIRIIVVSLMFSSISIFYVFSQESIYQSEVTITVGRYYLSDDIELKYKTRDKHISMAEAINSYFDSVLIDRKGRYIYKIQTRGNSKDATHKSLEKVIAFFFDFDKKKIDYKISLDQKAISDLNEMIHLEKNELNTLSKSQNLSASLIQYASELNLQLQKNINKYEHLINKLNNSDSTKYSQVIKKQETKKIDQMNGIVIILGSLLGFFTSIVTVLFLTALKANNE